MNKKYLAFIFLFLSSLIKLFSQQQLNVVHYSTSDGLSNSCVYGLHQDKKGNLWIATEFGLNKFDGNSFKSYDVSNGFPENTTLAISNGLGDEILVSTISKGVLKLQKDDKIGLFTNPFKGAQINKIVQIDSTFYFFNISGGNIASLDHKGNISYILNSKSSDTIINAICIFEKSILASANNGLYLLTHNSIKKLNINLINGTIYSLYNSNDGNIWLGGKGVLYKLNKKKLTITDSLIFDANKQNNVDCIVLDTKQKIWFSSILPANLYCATKTANAYSIENISEKLNLGNTDINDLLLDREHNVWIATYNKGLYCVRNTFLYSSSQFKNLYINSIYVDNKGIRYMGGINGITVINPITKQNFNISANKNVREYTYGFTQYKKDIFVLTNGIYKSIKINYNDNETVSPVAARSILFINDTTVLFGGWRNSVDIMKCKQNKFEFISSIKLEQKDTIVNRVNKLYKDINDEIWCGSDLGLYKINVAKKTSKKITDINVSLRITDVISTNKNTLWCATENSLVKFNGHKWESFIQIDGHKLGKVNSLAVDKKNRLYVGTYKGLFIFENGFNTFLDDKSGLLSNEINSLSYDKINQIMIMATNEGYAEFNIREYDNFKKQSLSIIIKSLAIKDSILPFSKKYIVTHNQNNLRLNYVAINLTYPKSVIYQYQVDDHSWVKTNSNTLELAALSYGEHHIKIRASLDNTNWCTPETVIIGVTSPFYFTARFWLIIILSILISSFFLIQLRIKLIQKKATEKIMLQKQLEDLKFKGLNATINPHFIFNSLNSIQNYINHNDKNKASNYLGKFARLIRLVLDKANEKEITIKEEIERLTFYIQLEQDRFDNSFSYTINTSKTINQIIIPNMIIQPLVENAILHGIKDKKNAHIEISFNKVQDILIINVDDNGIGLEASSTSHIGNHKSMAITNIRERLTLYPNSSLTITDKKNLNLSTSGTIAQITLQL